MKNLLTGLWVAVVLGSMCHIPLEADELDSLLETLRSAGPQGASSPEAAQVWEKIARTRAERLPAVLAAIDGTGPVAANWLRTAVDAMAQRQLARGGRLPNDELERFLMDTGHDPRARRLAYELLVRVDPSVQERLLPEMLDDPSVEIRRDAVAGLIEDAARVAKAGGSAEVLPVYRRALEAARDLDQIRDLAERLQAAGEEVELTRHFGYLLRWKLIGPFDNTDEKGFDAVYSPERDADYAASYEGKHGPVRWVDQVTTDQYGKVDLNRALGEEKGVVGYAAAEFQSRARQQVQFRASSSNALKVWLNGDLVAQHNVYHAGSQMDQYVARATLRPGRNTILLKICQNEQTQDWARNWEYQFRVCDETGGAILSTDRP